MRINSLRFRNLNSLKGEFFIDFDTPPLGGAGIFAITGPTGAGKTTILDAISVALYSETPRLSAGSNGELLSKHTGECYAEVTFTVPAGTYRSRWSRRRARGRGEGRLQASAMELVVIEEGGERIIEERVRAVVSKVVRLTGLDFVRFTRSVMLAQGGFASFLRAKGNERAELLEKMTGSRIYSLISIESFNRARQEKGKLDEMRVILDNLELMDEDEFAALLVLEIDCALEATSLQQSVTSLQGQVEGRRKFIDLRKNIAGCEGELKLLDEQRQESEPDLDRLARAEVALPLKADYCQEVELEKQLTGLDEEAPRLSKFIADLVEREKVLQAEQRRLHSEFRDFQAKTTEIEEKLLKVEKKDQLLSLRGKAFATLRDDYTVIRQTIETKEADRRGRDSANRSLQERLKVFQAFLREHHADAGLGRDLAPIAELLQELAERRGLLAAKQSELEGGAERIELLSKGLEDYKHRYTKSLEICAAHNEKTTALKGTIAVKLGAESVVELERRQSDLLALTNEYDALLELEVEIARQEEVVGHGQDAIKKAATDLEEKERCQKEMAKERGLEEKILCEIEKQQQLAMLVAKYEEARHNLKNDEPCPLCGALHHPWQDGAAIKPGAGLELNEQKKKVNRLTKELGALGGQIGELANGVRGYQIELANMEQHLVELRQRFCKKASIIECDSLAKEAITLKRQDRQSQLDELTANLDEVRRLQSELNTFLQEQVKLEQENAAVMREMGRKEDQVKEVLSRQQVCQRELPPLNERIVAIEKALAELLVGYKLDIPEPTAERRTREMLVERWQNYRETEASAFGADNELEAVRQAAAVLDSELKELKLRQIGKKAEVDAVEKELAVLRKDRIDLLGASSPATERLNLKRARKGWEERIQKSEQRVAALKNERAGKEELLANNMEKAEALGARLEETRRLFRGKLAAAGFCDRQELAAAFLEDSELIKLKEHRQALLERELTVKTRLAGAEEVLRSLDKEFCDDDLPEIETLLKVELVKNSEKQQELGALREAKRRQEKVAAEHRERLEQINRQKKEYGLWLRLSDLLGSADGKKFRRFAQGLTLDHLINLANRQLIRLNDRYLLRRNPEEELGIEVMDAYQADIVRPTGTLSGGEEFLVSLALALGLANLSGTSRVDSLFLDEGFGTLDTDSLETALAALACLHESGKNIAVISHVDALKERIPVQIQLQKLAGGYSEIVINC